MLLLWGSNGTIQFISISFDLMETVRFLLRAWLCSQPQLPPKPSAALLIYRSVSTSTLGPPRASYLSLNAVSITGLSTHSKCSIGADGLNKWAALCFEPDLVEKQTSWM